MAPYTGLIALLCSSLLFPSRGFSQTELQFDDGTAEIGMAWATPNNGAAVRFTVIPPVELQQVRVFVMTAQPATSLGILVLAANGPDSSPGDTLFGPVTFDWNETISSWSEYQFPQPVRIDSEDFYVAYYQTISGSLDAVPILGQDQTGEFPIRSWEWSDDQWIQLWEDSLHGNVMIRAIITNTTPTRATTWGLLKHRVLAGRPEGGP